MRCRHGQVWRLVTYIFIPQMGSLIPAPDWFNAVFSVFFLVWVGDRLEEAWGAFRLTLFVLIGVHRHNHRRIFLRREIFEWNVDLVVCSLLSRVSYPDAVIYFAYILPLKVKWIAWIYGAILLWQFLFASMAFRSALLVAFANYLIFFGREIILEARHRRDVSTRRQRFDSADAQCDRGTSASLCGLRRDGNKRSESRFSCRIRRRGILHVTPAERGRR